MRSLRPSLMTIAAALTLGAPIIASACGAPGEVMGTSFMATPVSMRGQFIYVHRISRRALRQAVAERQQSVRVAVPLPREIL